MSTLVLVLTAAMAVPGNGPEMVSGEATWERLDLSGKWEGNVTHEEGFSINASLEGDYLAEWMPVGNGPRVMASYQSSFSDDGPGRFRLTLNGERYVGIYKWVSGGVILCFQRAERGRPTSFRAGNGQCRLILHCVKPCK